MTNVVHQATRPLLEVSDLCVGFDTPAGLAQAVAGVSFALEQGHTVAIVGESGSGKTVLVRTLVGLVAGQNVRTGGSATYDGHDLIAIDGASRRHLLGEEIAMVFQDPMTALHPIKRIDRQIMEGPRLHEGLSKADARDLAGELLRSVHVAEPSRVLRQYPHQLSGGLRQRVMIAIAIACRPRLLIADEPTTALDATVQAQVLDILAEKQAERAMAMVLISHDLDVVRERTDQVVVMYAGTVLEAGPTSIVLGDPRSPYTEALLDAVPRPDRPPRLPLRAIEGQPPSPLDPAPGCRFAPRCRYARERCHAERPPLSAVGGGQRQVSCWFPVGQDGSGGAATSGRSTNRAAPPPPTRAAR